eukprot:gnl/Hemi2/16187_TR5377_c0_g1_i1.p1 gnl/Hemi2/16187_TR5377_c0_g1~~gnl/Hemi2/16187_TR5377_c0_g1_i1.p1  ORF type:complete len:588 (+),score=215.73 gnl/Hemi2/16187_TR5377_c0_g1_i1:120-1883(+)
MVQHRLVAVLLLVGCCCVSLAAGGYSPIFAVNKPTFQPEDAVVLSYGGQGPLGSHSDLLLTFDPEMLEKVSSSWDSCKIVAAERLMRCNCTGQNVPAFNITATLRKNATGEAHICISGYVGDAHSMSTYDFVQTLPVVTPSGTTTLKMDGGLSAYQAQPQATVAFTGSVTVLGPSDALGASVLFTPGPGLDITVAECGANATVSGHRDANCSCKISPQGFATCTLPASLAVGTVVPIRAWFAVSPTVDPTQEFDMTFAATVSAKNENPVQQHASHLVLPIRVAPVVSGLLMGLQDFYINLVSGAPSSAKSSDLIQMTVSPTIPVCTDGSPATAAKTAMYRAPGGMDLTVLANATVFAYLTTGLDLSAMTKSNWTLRSTDDSGLLYSFDLGNVSYVDVCSLSLPLTVVVTDVSKNARYEHIRFSAASDNQDTPSEDNLNGQSSRVFLDNSQAALLSSSLPAQPWNYQNQPVYKMEWSVTNEGTGPAEHATALLWLETAQDPGSLTLLDFNNTAASCQLVSQPKHCSSPAQVSCKLGTIAPGQTVSGIINYTVTKTDVFFGAAHMIYSASNVQNQRGAPHYPLIFNLSF